MHAWWLFREPLIFESEEERRDAGNLALRWQSLLRANAAARGWAFDRLADLARVLRVPGTQNCKDPANLKPVSIHSQTGRRYNPSDFVEFLEGQGIPKAEEQERTCRAWKEESADKPLSINPNATVPDDLLNQYMADPRFKKTWLRQREDLKDQSQSGYDLALANFGHGQPWASCGLRYPPTDQANQFKAVEDLGALGTVLRMCVVFLRRQHFVSYIGGCPSRPLLSANSRYCDDCLRD